MSAGDHRVTLVTRAACHLCADAEVVLRRLATELRFAYREVDVDASPALRDEFGDRVPVVLLDGKEHAYWTVDEPRLRRSLLR